MKKKELSSRREWHMKIKWSNCKLFPRGVGYKVGKKGKLDGMVGQCEVKGW